MNKTIIVKIGQIVKSKSGNLYEVQNIIESHTLGETVLVCYRLSAYDGMPIGSLVHIFKSEVE